MLTTHKLAEIKGLSAQYFENQHCKGSVPVPRCAGQCVGRQDFPDFLQMLCETAHLPRARQEQTLRGWRVSGSSFPGPCFSCRALLRRLEDNFPETLQANNRHKSHNHCTSWTEREQAGVHCMLCVKPSPAPNSDTSLYSTFLLEEKAEKQSMVNLCKYNLSLLNSYLELTSFPHSQRTVNNTFLPTSCITEMLLLGWMLSLFTIRTYSFLVIFLIHPKGYSCSIYHFNFTPKPMKSTRPFSPLSSGQQRWSASFILIESRPKTKPKPHNILKLILW